MDKSIRFYLVTEGYTTDTIGQKVPTQTPRQVLGRVSSITRAEWSAAGQFGLQPAKMIKMFGPDYQGEKIAYTVAPDGAVTAYGIYRTHEGRNDTIELYLEWKPGDSSNLAPTHRIVVDANGDPLKTSTGAWVLVEV